MAETFKNQQKTMALAARMHSQTQQEKSQRRKVVVLSLDERQQRALERLGGTEALLELLCPPGLCLQCRKEPASSQDLCDSCHAASLNAPLENAAHESR
jgi:hypothetical protein